MDKELKPFDSKSCKLGEVFKNHKKFGIDDYQREYMWNSENMIDLIDDLFCKFNEDYKINDKTDDVDNKYGYYFLNKIVLVPTKKCYKIVDGQQRLTSLTLISIYLYRFLKDDDNKKKAKNFKNKKSAELYKVIIDDEASDDSDNCDDVYRMDIENRTELFKILFEDEDLSIKIGTKSEQIKEVIYSKINAINGIENKNDISIDNLINAYTVLNDYFEDYFKNNIHDYDKIYLFSRWFLKKVYLEVMELINEEEAYWMFISINNRGLSLSETDLIKSYIMNNIKDTEKKEKANEIWSNNFNKLYSKKIIKPGNTKNSFIIDFFRSKYVNINNRKIDEFKEVGKNPYRWFVEYTNGINNFNFYNFISCDFNDYCQNYIYMNEDNKDTNEKFKHLRYNKKRGEGYSMQPLLILSAINHADMERDEKIQLISHFNDILMELKILNGDKMDQVAVKNEYKNLINLIRGKNKKEIAKELINYLNVNYINAKDAYGNNKNIKNGINSSKYDMKKNNRRMLLVRINCYLEMKNGNCANEYELFKLYYNSGKKNGYDIEHVLAQQGWENYKNYQGKDGKKLFNNEEEYNECCKDIGNQILLQKNLNSSCSNKIYKNKIGIYNNNGTILSKILTKDFYGDENNKTNTKASLNKLKSLGAKPFEEFDKNAIEHNRNFYITIAEKIWNIDDLKKYI